MIREGCTIYDIDIRNKEDYVVLLNYDNEEETAQGYVKYRIVNDNPLKISIAEVWLDDELSIDDGLKSNFLKKMIQYALEQVYEIGGEVVDGCKEVEDFIKEMKDEQQEIENKKYLREIEPQGNDGSKKLIVDSEYSFIEYPVREAVKRMNQSGMKTIMSSSNKDDVENGGQKETTFDEHIYIGQNTHFSIGNGYAWIMVDYARLSNELKQKIIDLNSSKIAAPLSDTAKTYFNENCMANGCEATQSELIKFYRVWQKRPTEVTETFPHRDDLDAKITQLKREIEEIQKEAAELHAKLYKTRELKDKKGKLYAYIREKERCDRLSDEDKYFEDNMTTLYHENSLGYNGADYKAVVFRYPVGEDTTIEEVKQYYQELINIILRERNKDDKKDTQELGKETIHELEDTKYMEETETTINEMQEDIENSQNK